MQKKIKELNNFAENDCRKCELRAACFLAAADWKQARKDYPCFYPVEGLIKEIVKEDLSQKEQQTQKRIKKLLTLFYIESVIITGLTVFLLFAR